MLWLIPVGISVAALAHSIQHARLASTSGPTRTIGLDSALPRPAAHGIIAMIMDAKSPSQLDALAAQYRAYPYAYYELSYRAWELRGSHGPAPERPRGAGVGARSGAAPAGAMRVAPARQAPPPPPMEVDLVAAAISAAGGGVDAISPAAPGEISVVTTYGAGNGWTLLPSAQGFSFSAPMDASNLPGEVIVEASRLAQAGIGIGAAQLEQLDADGSTWLFGNNGGMVLILQATPPQTQTGYVDPMARKPPYTTEYREDVAGIVGVDVNHSVIAAQDDDDDIADPGGETAVGTGVVELTGGAGVPDITGSVTDITGSGVPDLVGARPLGSWHVHVRPTDKVWPRRLAEIGTGIDRGSPAAIEHLTDLNPHLAAPGGRTIRELRAGDQINVPASWAAKLKTKGFEVRQD